MGLTLKGVSTSLGISRNTAGNYCVGKRCDKQDEVEIPMHILLACAAIEHKLPPIK